MKEDCDELLTGSREIFAFGEVDIEFSRRLMRDICHLRSLKDRDPITIYLNSVGGDVGLGLGLYDFIQSLKCHVTIIGVGEVASAATLILQAADKRVLTGNSIMMLHGLTIGTENTIDNVETYLKASKLSQASMLTIYSEKSNLTVVSLRNKLQRDWYITSEEALKLGFIDERI